MGLGQVRKIGAKVVEVKREIVTRDNTAAAAGSSGAFVGGATADMTGQLIRTALAG